MSDLLITNVDVLTDKGTLTNHAIEIYFVKATPKLLVFLPIIANNIP